jgi:uncharacterized protein
MDTTILVCMCMASFLAGFVDAIVGGGGLIQLPIGIVLLPQKPINVIVATLKLPAFFGTGFAAYQYAQKNNTYWRLLGLLMPLAAVAALCGSQLLTVVHNNFMKPILLVVLVLVAIYTFTKKDFGSAEQLPPSTGKGFRWKAMAITLIIGFYDGFIGPGTGSFLILAFITILGYDFLHASATAKLINLATNCGSIVLFILKGKIWWTLAIPMAVANSAGGILGAHLAISKGNQFIRKVFLVVVTATLLRFGYDVFVH